ncbi:MAG: LacI family DNA-binding transcriptional regulator [Bacteroidetes bacterium]|nr:LacI family DNA-binding transcriptional regulator [Bacteroidota bacterium]
MGFQPNTLKKLSEILGISISTVSRALKDHPDISTKTKARVKELAAALDYEPNNFAVQLRTQQSNVLGILVPTIRNYFYDFFISAVEEEAVKQGYSIMIMQSLDKLSLEISNINVLRRNKIMGLFVSISIETEDMTPFRKLHDSGVPVVFFDRVAEVSGFSKVCLADEIAAQIAAKSIIEKGKKNVLALFGHPHLSITKLRYASFKKYFEIHAKDTKVTYFFPEHIEGSRQVCLDVFKKEIPDAVFCMGDMILMGVMHAVHETKLKVPEEISIIGISNGLIPTLYDPKITYVETSGFKLGKLAFKQMYAALKGNKETEEVILESILVEGGSL